ncbi:MAG TPA: SDR family oxidoreductase [Acidobacteriaceae bacterium]|nr:SDR family oxidoreductase [Acidobacteriaceae bacterium]
MPNDRILVLGATGQLGAALCRQLGPAAIPAARRPPSPDWLTLDLATLTESPDELVSTHSLTAIICSAGATDVERCESDHAWADAANHLGPLALARAAAHARIPFVFYSTDYVFPGTPENPGPYREDAATHPLSVYGGTKRLGEVEILKENPAALVLRTTTVYGPDPQGKNFLYTLRRLLTAGQSMRVPTDQLATPTYNEDLAAATLALLRGGYSGLFHAAGPTMLSRIAFARLACQILSLDDSLLLPLTTSQLQQRAARPLIAGLDSTKLNTTLGRQFFRTPEQGIRDWQATLA